MFHINNLVISLVLFSAVQTIQCLTVTFYQDINHSGDAQSFNLCSNDCVALGTNEIWNDRFSSVNTANGCIIMFEDTNCQGRAVRVEPGTNCHGSFLDCTMNDKVSSLKLC